MLKTEAPTDRRVLIPYEVIIERISELAQEIADWFKSVRVDESECLHLIYVTEGAAVFYGLLAPQLGRLGIKGVVTSINSSSYGQNIGSPLDEPLVQPIRRTEFSQQSHVLVIEDLIDSGKTLARILSAVAVLKPSSLQVALLLAKVDEDESSLDILGEQSFVGFKVPLKLWVDGFGIDSAHHNRLEADIGYIYQTEKDEKEYLDYMQWVAVNSHKDWSPTTASALQ